jgi:hypothetical protein
MLRLRDRHKKARTGQHRTHSRDTFDHVSLESPESDTHFLNNEYAAPDCEHNGGLKGNTAPLKLL